MLLGSLKRRGGVICVCFLVNRSKFSTKSTGKHEQMSPLIAGSEESLGHISPSTLLLVRGGLRSPGGYELVHSLGISFALGQCFLQKAAFLWADL